MPRKATLVWLAGLIFLGARPIEAQRMPAPPRLEAESVQATTRVEALERGVQPGTDAQRACMLMTAFASAPDQVWGALGAQINADDAAWDDALAESRRLVRELGEKLVPAGQVSPVSTLPAPFVRVSLRIEEIVRSWPASIRARQRASLEREASDLFARAVKGRSEGLLRRVVAEHEGSVKWGEAAELLGDIAFARGRLEEALGWWLRLTPLPSEALARAIEEGEQPASLAGLERSLVLARVRAKQVLALAYANDLVLARRELKALDTLHPATKGELLGKKGLYARLVDDALRELSLAGTGPDADWVSLGGEPTRQRLTLHTTKPPLWPKEPRWRAPFPEAPKRPKRDKERLGSAPRRAAYYPIILGDNLVVADGRGIAVFDVRDGKERFRERWLDLDKAAGSPELPVFAASGEGQMAVFRLGSPPDNEASIKDGAEETTWLVGVDLSADTPKGKRLRWKLSVPVERPKEAYFSGPPLWYRDKVWIPYQEWRGARLFQGIAALNPETGRWLVKTLIGEAPRLPPGREGVRQPALLTAAGPIIVCCTQAGVIVGVDRASGQVVWGLSYPSAGPWTRLVTPSTRDAAAPVFHLGRVFVAPQDSDLLLCLDAATGRTIWEREVLDIVNLLGCSHGKLIVTTARDLRAFAEATGSDRTGWIVPGEGSLAPLGRGLILGGVVLWPTQDDEAPLRAVSVEEGAPELKAAKGERPVLLGPELLRGLRAGNMAYAHGYLVVAGEKELMVFGPPDAKDGGGKREFPVDREEEPEEVIEGALVVPERKAAAEGAYREEWRIAGKLIPQAGRADAVLVRRAAEVLHVDGRNGTVRWRQKGRGEHAWVAGDMVLLSGPDEVVARKSESGERSWRFENPFGEGRLETLGLSERWLVVTWERRKLFLLDRVTGAARLSVWAPGATALLAGAEGRFQAWVAAMDQGVVVQTGGGTLLRFVEDAAGNIVTTRQEAAPVETPVAFNDGSIVLGQPGGVVERRDLEKRTVRWRFEAKGASSSAAPWLAALGGGVVVVVRRNLGDEVVCLDGAGKPRWRLEWSLFPRGLSTIGAGGDRLFFSHAGRVLCVDGATGTIAWKVELPAEAGAWRFLYHHGLLLVYPAGEARTLPSEMRLFPATTLVWRRHHVIASDDAVFFLLDPVHGRIVQRIQVERGPGPYLTQALPSGFAVSNGRSVTAFLATARK